LKEKRIGIQLYAGNSEYGKLLVLQVIMFTCGQSAGNLNNMSKAESYIPSFDVGGKNNEEQFDQGSEEIKKSEEKIEIPSQDIIENEKIVTLGERVLTDVEKLKKRLGNFGENQIDHLSDEQKKKIIQLVNEINSLLATQG
jgi:glutamyl/glutaminyl-tRNA synthetase